MPECTINPTYPTIVRDGAGAVYSRAAHTINPAVFHEAELFTDGAITPALLADVAAMSGLPLYAPEPGSLADLEADLAHARSMLAQHRLGYADACANLGVANRSTCKGFPLSREAVRAAAVRWPCGGSTKSAAGSATSPRNWRRPRPRWPRSARPPGRPTSPWPREARL